MKKSGLLLFIIIMLVSCRKDYLIPDNEVPAWLKDKIKHDESVIKDSPQSSLNYGAWIRYNWQNEYYFEYQNVLSSSLPRPISTKGDTLHNFATDVNTDYYKEKCCRRFVWKAPEFRDLPGL